MNLQRLAAALLRSTNLLVAAVVTSFIVAAGLTALRADAYETRSLVDVNRLLDDEDAFSNSERADRTVANELVNAESIAVEQLASQRLGGKTSEVLQRDVTIEQLTGTDNIMFTARAADADTAALTATKYAESYAATRLDQRQEALRRETEEVGRELLTLQEQFAAPALDTAQAESQEQALREQYAELVGRELELRGSARLTQDPQQFVLPAPVPDSTAGPGPLVWGALAALLTLACGIVLVALFGRSRDPVEFRSDLEEFDLPVLAEAPAPRGLWGRRSSTSAAMQSTAVSLSMRDPVPAVLTLLSVEAQGNTEVLSALSDFLSQQGATVYRTPSSRPGSASTDGPKRITLLEGSLHDRGAEGLRSLKHADLILVVVSRGVTRRADLARVIDELEQLSATTPRLALLLAPDRRKPRSEKEPSLHAWSPELPLEESGWPSRAPQR